jgi:hypothetical protein
LPTPEKDSSNSTTRIFAIASSLCAKSKTAPSESSPLFTRAFVAALTCREAVDFASAADLCSAVNFGGIGII